MSSDRRLQRPRGELKISPFVRAEYGQGKESTKGHGRRVMTW